MDEVEIITKETEVTSIYISILYTIRFTKEKYKIRALTPKVFPFCSTSKEQENLPIMYIWLISQNCFHRNLIFLKSLTDENITYFTKTVCTINKQAIISDKCTIIAFNFFKNSTKQSATNLDNNFTPN